MTSQRRESSSSPSKPLPTASPSASILLISPSNEILLLRRVKKSTSFASAHVFPGGHIDPEDGPLPPHDDIRIHEDNPAYRMGAVRECFEESGILLARSRDDPSMLLQLTEGERHEGRHAVHEKRVRFDDWVHSHGGIPDVESLHPFTRWLTPTNISRRYSTQMYLYFLPLANSNIPQTLHIPTSDGGIEHTEAEFLPATEWITRAQEDKIILFPPQFFLLSLIAEHLKSPVPGGLGHPSTKTLQSERDFLSSFLKTGDPPWGEKCISPRTLKKEGKNLILALDEPGSELEGTNRRGDAERVVWVRQKGKEGMSGLEVGWRRDVAIDESQESGEARRKECESGGRDKDLEQALRGRKENL
ncbi:MAG: hypothetical protein Q9219_006330 [cf. Caloplaca sp. 3 TL-2023]